MPIRHLFARYADLVVHRVLAAAIDGVGAPVIAAEVSAQSVVCNERKLAAKKAQDASASVFVAVFVFEHGPFIEDGVVFKLQDRSFDVMVKRLGIEVRVLLDRLETIESYEYDNSSKTQTLTWPPDVCGGGGDSDASCRQEFIKMFSKVKVHVSCVKNGAKMNLVAKMVPSIDQ